jgi:hypothetical protein
VRSDYRRENIVGVNRGKTNDVARRFIDTLVQEIPEGGDICTNSICRKINAADRRRRYNSMSIGNLLAERDDVEKTWRGWRKKKVEA